ncbi:hypothetical protein POF50_021965 [Streptomyces sp. SL13]|uniref:Uncharacterized protein n=1 Tax=Streptantibioticus silvisoli TaxID=2705255 RepID=A0AA90KHX1_9ACTN|nr:hypothetical protein [Streptantibioticus silvisoli]MDI5971969.1 hypothetical protein [Streptantibioticus silvisoli]
MTTPATAGEALAGLARARDNRPAEVLDEATAIRRLYGLLDRHHPGEPAARGSLRLLARNSGTTVAAIGVPPIAVLKVHADPERYQGEALAYALTAPTPVIPDLICADDVSRSLLIPYLPRPVDWSEDRVPHDLVTAVAAVHCASAHYDDATAEATTSLRLDHQAAVPAWITDRHAWTDVLALCGEAHGSGHVPLGHLDLKPDHLRRRADGSPALLDIETLRPDITGLIDLISLPAVLRQAGHSVPAPYLLNLYAEATGWHGARWTAQLLRIALRAYQSVTALATLDGLAD